MPLRNIVPVFRPLVRCLGTSRSFSSRILVVAPQESATLNPAAYNAVTAAKQIGDDITILVSGDSCDDAVKEASSISDVTSVITAQHKALGHCVAENMTNVVVDIHQKNEYSHIITAADNVGKSFLPRIGATLDAQPITDIIGIESEDIFVRPTYAGNALVTVQSEDTVKLMTIRPTSFESAESSDSSAPIETYDVADSIDAGLSQWASDEMSSSDRPDLGTAPAVVSGGRGMQNGENFAMLEELADTMGGAVGASRAAVDAGMVPNDMQIGQTGKVVAPDLYVAVGISGAIQHLAGMKDSKTIVAINKDEEAPIFQVADYGLVADLFNAVPEMTKKMKET